MCLCFCLCLCLCTSQDLSRQWQSRVKTITFTSWRPVISKHRFTIICISQINLGDSVWHCDTSTSWLPFSFGNLPTKTALMSISLHLLTNSSFSSLSRFLQSLYRLEGKQSFVTEQFLSLSLGTISAAQLSSAQLIISACPPSNCVVCPLWKPGAARWPPAIVASQCTTSAAPGETDSPSAPSSTTFGLI